MSKIHILDAAEYINDFARTSVYIYSYVMDDPEFFANVDEAMHIAHKFMEKYPVGTDWEKQEWDWETTIHKFYLDNRK